MKKYFKLSSGNFLFILSLFLITSCGSLKKTQTKNETADQSKVIKDPKEGVDDEDESYTGGEIVVTNPATDDSSENLVVLNPGEYRAGFFADSITMEEVYKPMLNPIKSLESEDPDMYWFIVSWLNTAYKSPPAWSGYDNYDSWRVKTLARGIDCSGFTRVAADRLYNLNIMGSSSNIYNSQVTKIDRNKLQKGDLVFFTFPGSQDRRIVHIGMYVKDDLFVHATSTRSASLGRGLSINSLNEQRWSGAYVGGGRILKSN